MVEKFEVLNTLVSEDAEPPARERDVTGYRAVEAVCEADGAEGALMHGEDASDGIDDGGRHEPTIGEHREEVNVAKNEGCGGPDTAPARGEHGCARGVLEGEARDDGGEQLVRKAADAILAAAVDVRGGLGAVPGTAPATGEHGWARGVAEGMESSSSGRRLMRPSPTLTAEVAREQPAGEEARRTPSLSGLSREGRGGAAGDGGVCGGSHQRGGQGEEFWACSLGISNYKAFQKI